jgi:6-phosphogluconolactonase
MRRALTAVAVALAVPAGLGARHAAAQDPRPARWALATSDLGNSASVYAIDAGRLALRATVATAGEPRAIAVHPNGRFVYLASQATASVQILRFDPASGTLTAGVLVPLPGNAPDPGPEVVAVEPLGRFLYVTNRGSNTLQGFRIDPATGDLSPLPGFPIAAGTQPYDIVFDPHGSRAFVSNVVDATISAYRLRFTGTLTPVPGSPFATPLEHPEGLAVDPSGRFLFVTHVLRSAVSAFRFDHRGVLAPVPGSPFAAGADPIAAATSTDGRALYVSDAAIETVLMRRIDAQTGALSPMAPPRVSAGNNVNLVRADPSGRFVYVGASQPGAIYSYAVDAAGVLTPVAGSPVAVDGGVRWLALVP